MFFCEEAASMLPTLYGKASTCSAFFFIFAHKCNSMSQNIDKGVNF